MDKIQILCCGQCFFRLYDDLAQVLPGDGVFFNHLIKSTAVDELHHHVGTIVIYSGIIDRYDVWMLNRGECSGFFEEVFGGFLLVFVPSIGEHALNGNLSV